MTNEFSLQTQNSKRLVRSVNNRFIAGVCGGIAKTYNIDATLVRLLFAALLLAGFSGLLSDVICWIVIPNAWQY